MDESSPADFTIHHVETWDGLYAPIAVRAPRGDGPFPIVLLASGNGGRGEAWLKEVMADRSYVVDRILDAGYACAWTRYRMEIDDGYAKAEPFSRRPGPGNEVFNRSPLEYEDAMAIAEYVKGLPFVDEDRVAWVGVSHGGEMLLKMSAEYSGFAAGVACEPASHEFFGVHEHIREIKAAGNARRPSQVSADDLAMVRGLMPEDLVAQRIAKIETPMLVMGRPQDNLQAIFRLTYDVLAEAGKDVEWADYDHYLHGYIYPMRGADGKYEVDAAQEESINEILAYLGRYL
jgi:Prolyl oligopeptidase family